MRLLWLSDVHLNFLPTSDAAQTFGAYLGVEQKFDRVIVSGDIAEAPTVRDLLNCFARGVGCQVSFVLGNHDYYGGSIAGVHKEMVEGLDPNLTWLDIAEPTLLDDTTALVGNQGWYDGLIGKAKESRVILSDFQVIKDFRPLFQEMYWLHYAEQGSRSELLAKLQALSRHCAIEAKTRLVEALGQRKNVIFVTHFPPFKGSCWHEGKISDDHWLPWFTSGAMGHMLGQLAASHPENNILVLCGHTHSPGLYQHAKNLRVLTGKAVYGAPDVAGLIDTQVAFEDWTVLKR